MMKKPTKRSHSAVSNILSYLLVFILLATLMVSSVQMATILVNQKKGEVAAIPVQGIADKIADALVEAYQASTLMPESTYQKTIDIPEDIIGKQYTVSISSSNVTIQTVDGTITRRAPLYNITGVNLPTTPLLSSSGKLDISYQPAGETIKLDFGSKKSIDSDPYISYSPVETGWYMVTNKVLTWADTGPPLVDYKDYQYRLFFNVNNTKPATIDDPNRRGSTFTVIPLVLTPFNFPYDKAHVTTDPANDAMSSCDFAINWRGKPKWPSNLPGFAKSLKTANFSIDRWDPKGNSVILIKMPYTDGALTGPDVILPPPPIPLSIYSLLYFDSSSTTTVKFHDTVTLGSFDISGEEIIDDFEYADDSGDQQNITWIKTGAPSHSYSNGVLRLKKGDYFISQKDLLPGKDNIVFSDATDSYTRMFVLEAKMRIIGGAGNADLILFSDDPDYTKKSYICEVSEIDDPTAITLPPLKRKPIVQLGKYNPSFVGINWIPSPDYKESWFRLKAYIHTEMHTGGSNAGKKFFNFVDIRLYNNSQREPNSKNQYSDTSSTVDFSTRGQLGIGFLNVLNKQITGDPVLEVDWIRVTTLQADYQPKVTVGAIESRNWEWSADVNGFDRTIDNNPPYKIDSVRVDGCQGQTDKTFTLHGKNANYPDGLPAGHYRFTIIKGDLKIERSGYTISIIGNAAGYPSSINIPKTAAGEFVEIPVDIHITTEGNDIALQFPVSVDSWIINGLIIEKYPQENPLIPLGITIQ